MLRIIAKYFRFLGRSKPCRNSTNGTYFLPPVDMPGHFVGKCRSLWKNQMAGVGPGPQFVWTLRPNCGIFPVWAESLIVSLQSES